MFLLLRIPKGGSRDVSASATTTALSQHFLRCDRGSRLALQSGMRSRAQLLTTVVAVIAAMAPAFSANTSAAGARQAIDVQRSTITIHVFKTGLFRAFADNHLIQAPVAEGSIDESAVPHVDLVIEAQRLQVLDPKLSPKDRKQVQERMLGAEVLDTARFPQIRFHSTAVEQLASEHWLVRGALELHGQTRSVSVKVTRENGRYTGLTTLRQTDFGITPVSVAGGTVKVKDEISIEFDIVPTNP